MAVMSTTTPSSPRNLPGYFFSAPTSPRRVAEFYRDYDDTSADDFLSKSLFVPFDGEEKPGTPKSPDNDINFPRDGDDDDDDDFAFDIGDRSETASLYAEELFDGGKIKPLQPQPGFRSDDIDQSKKTSPLSPISQGKNLLRKAFSPKKKPLDDVDPFEAAIENPRNGSRRERGRQLAHDSSRRSARSLSPYRVSAYPWEEEEEHEHEQEQEQKKEESEPSLSKKGSLSSTASSSSSSSSSSSRKWRLRDFLLFRSASEGRAKQKDSIMKFSGFFKKHEDVKHSNSSSSSQSNNRRRSSISPHEFHYITKKAESKDMKKKTFLPYKQIGRFAF